MQQEQKIGASVPIFDSGLKDETGKAIFLQKSAAAAMFQFMAVGKRATDRVGQQGMAVRQAEYEAYQERIRRQKELIAPQERSRNRSFALKKKALWAEQKVKQEAKSGDVMLRVYEDLGPVWTSSWLADYITPDIPEMAFARLNVTLTCKALMRGLEAYKERRRQRKTVDDPVAFVTAVAAAWQKNKPTYLVPLEEALLTPERIAPSR